jgi:outer membrane lipoprotein
MKILIAAGIVLLLGGCATAPKPLRGEYAGVLPEQAAASQTLEATVRLGGSIVEVTPAADRTCIEILGRELGDSARPRLTPDESAGRFIACRAGFYDPAIFAAEREVTVTGRIDGYETRRIGDYDYRYPRVAADVIYLWPERGDQAYYYPAPYWPVFRPHWWGGYYVPVRAAGPRPPRSKN